MPWKPEDAKSHTKKAATKIAQRQWADVANSVYERDGDEGKAVRIANGVVGKRHAAARRGKEADSE